MNKLLAIIAIGLLFSSAYIGVEKYNENTDKSQQSTVKKLNSGEAAKNSSGYVEVEGNGNPNALPANPAPQPVIHPKNITVTGDNGIIITIYGDTGKIEKGPGLSNDKAAKEFLKVLAKVFPDWKTGICEGKPDAGK
jgi:hypothetical protein